MNLNNATVSWINSKIDLIEAQIHKKGCSLSEGDFDILQECQNSLVNLKQNLSNLSQEDCALELVSLTVKCLKLFPRISNSQLQQDFFEEFIKDIPN